MSGLEGATARIRVADEATALAEVLGRPGVYHLLDRLAEQGLRRAQFEGPAARGLEQALGSRYRELELVYPGGGDAPDGGPLPAFDATERRPAHRAGAGLRAAAFLDRDGTIIEDKHYLHDPEGVELIPGAAQGLRRMRAQGLALVLVSNQSGVGRGYFGRGDVERVHGRLIELLAEQGVTLDAFYICPHAPEQGCACRKPATGMVQRACAELGLDAGASFVIGDKPCDVELAQAAGGRGVLVRTGKGERHAAELAAQGVSVARDLDEAAEIIAALRG